MTLTDYFQLLFLFTATNYENFRLTFAEKFQQKQPFQFSKDYFVATYDPYVNPDLVGNRYAYNEFEQIQFLELVSTKFSTILVNTTYEDMHDKNTSLALASSSAAQLNLNYAHVKLTVWLSVQRNVSDGYPNGYLSEQCEHLVEIADRANNIFPGTVTTLVFRYDYCWFSRRFIHDEDLKNCRTSILRQSPHNYNILLFLDSLDCEKIKECLIERNPVFSQADYILFKEIPPLELLESGVDSFFPIFQAKLEKCKRYIADSVTRQNVQVGVISTWLSKNEFYYDQNEQWYEITQYWQKLNNWSSATKSPVVLMKTFDTPYETNVSLKTTGWWFLEKNQYNSSSEYKFNEKYELCCNQANLSTDGNELIVLENWLQNISKKTFDNNLIGVWFDPFVKPEINGKYDEFEVKAMVRLILSKFSNILIRSLFQSDDISDQVVLLIPKILGMECQKYGRKNLQLSIFLLASPITNEEKRGIFFRKTKFIADQLDEKCEHNVKRLILPYRYDSYNWSVDYIKNMLINESQTLTGSSYMLGVQLPISWCEQHFFATINRFFERKPSEFLETVDLIYLLVEPAENSDNMKVDRIVWQVIHRFTKCRNKVAKDMGLDPVNSSVPLVLMTYYRPKIGIYNDFTSLVNYLKFWESITEWAITSNNSVVLYEAFDNPGKSELRERGWWRLISNYTQNSNYKIDQNAFEEKTTAALKLALKHRQDISSIKEQKLTTLSSQWEFVLAIIGVPVFVSIVIAIVAVYFIRRARQQYLSNSEILDFFNGTTNKTDKTNNENDGIIAKPYNKDTHELSPYSFTLGCVIGQGNFGVVQKAIVNGEVAVMKVPKNDCSKEAFKSTLNEIKVLSYVGNHVNVVRFLGAYTKSIKKGKVYIAMEYCTGGCLQSYLRTKSVENVRISVYELGKFCWEIASGMEYIAFRKIIHGDLSTRNVLLTEDHACKIGDFGLSRKLYECSLYIKSNKEEALPWRWLALESLKRMEFTTETDVWSFGVTVWEVFSMGDVPYPGMIWSGDFVNKIESGVRMGCPTGCSDTVYQKMLECWNADPKSRPSFSVVRQFFMAIMEDDYEKIN